jgi:hypothetical protein
VLPNFDNTVYIKIEDGDHFGHSDISLSSKYFYSNRFLQKKSIKRKPHIHHFTVLALIDCDMLILSIDDLDKMKLEFPQVFRDLFVNAATLLKK